MAIGDGVSAIAQLTAGFGGFGPTAFDGVEESKRQVQQAEEILARMREMQERRRELERARTSKPRSFTDGKGTAWTYVVIDDRVIRIVGCTPNVTVLEVPAEIDGYPVYSIGSDACSRLEEVEEIICPDSIELIRSCAFRECPDLRRVVLPENVSEFNVSWLQRCHALEELVLPGLLETITSAVFDNENLKRLRIGRNVKTIVPGAFEKTHLEILELDGDNPYLMTDGTALYSADGSVLIALGRPTERYEVAEGCVKIAKKAFANIASLRSITLPSSLEVVGKFAYAGSGLHRVTVPTNVRVISEKAFLNCKAIEEVTLNEGLVRIDDSAFYGSSLKSLFIPSSIQSIGTSVVAHSNVVRSGPDATISIDPRCETLFLDESGGLYRREDDGLHLIQLIDPDVTHFSAHGDTRYVDERAFALLPNIQVVSLPNGVEEVRESAFRVCSSLVRVELPDSVRVIGKEAFFDTHLQSIRIPAALGSLGENALVTAGAHRLSDPPSLKSVEVSPENDRFFVDAGMLIERTDSGNRIIVYTGERPDVEIPDTVTSIAPFAFSNVRGIRTLHLPSSIRIVGTSGLGVWSYIELIHVDVAKPIEGCSSFDFRFPNTDRSVHSISLALGGSTWVNVPDIMAQYDNCLANSHDYQGNNRDSISIYEQVSRVVERLREPILLTNVNRKNFERLFQWHLEEICVDVARHDDRELMDALLEFGFLNESNLEQVISAVGRLQDAAMTAYLLEVKRRRFNQRTFDFDL
ncbi:MAG: leucine-rich repeat domain-containing protein [Eggerthellaceae bacterium]|nr:leucine-rich repeat domain-containing protein [Eggerthellaceae bacterium]